LKTVRPVGTRHERTHREFILVKEYIIVRWPARPQQAGVAAKGIVPFYRAVDVCVDNRARETVAATIGAIFVVGIGGEEYSTTL